MYFKLREKEKKKPEQKTPTGLCVLVNRKEAKTEPNTLLLKQSLKKSEQFH